MRRRSDGDEEALRCANNDFSLLSDWLLAIGAHVHYP